MTTPQPRAEEPDNTESDVATDPTGRRQAEPHRPIDDPRSETSPDELDRSDAHGQ